MASTAQSADSVSKLTLNIEEEINVQAPIAIVFESLLEQFGPEFSTAEGESLKMKLEAWPGGRLYRDLGNGDGHFWGNVQSIKRPSLLEICGPLFMSYPVISNVQYRLSEVPGGTLIKFHHSALGFIPDNVRENLTKGWGQIHGQLRTRAEAKRPQ